MIRNLGYRTTLTPGRARTPLLEYIDTPNSLAEKAHWYNAITTNCTTAIRSQNHHGDRAPWDWRILVNRAFLSRKLLVTWHFPDYR